MAERFEDLGIAPELVAGVEGLGWDAPAGLQRDAVPVLRRGNNLVVHASAGSGVVGAYGLGVLDRLLTDDGDGLRVLVLVPDAVAASATADSLARLVATTGLTVGATAPGWTRRDTDILVASATAAAAAVRDSSLKLGDLAALIVDGADRLADSDQWADLETLVDAVPGAAQRVLVTGRLDSRIDDFVERHVRRAMTIPPRAGDEAAPTAGAPVRYAVTAAADRTAAAVHLLEGLDAPEIAVVCRTLDGAERVGRELAARGVPVRGAQGTGADSPGAR
ncbi:MAG: DEAD/DEAH box helicase, partial [Gemmatimonadetes bacterium]|nr:DEAD/DEAH box helicase [Gemmatimonadota bacterium]NIQ53496.1 DEAD/DEAH box helicase [Gemmatimonadota bacterium]NIU73638.1 DEAD/DEAH box helicase [Gammaproteobacteria bacterium]NIX43819.1 DEAD/DEAH box helicase [Gemmatimonadota bacterium]NIY08020.1 DEAD/DEAH box helicase [Gemmatimonadota bacterium]